MEPALGPVPRCEHGYRLTGADGSCGVCLTAERDLLRGLLALAYDHISPGASLRVRIKEALDG